jgi:hypothetical protein
MTREAEWGPTAGDESMVALASPTVNESLKVPIIAR